MERGNKEDKEESEEESKDLVRSRKESGMDNSFDIPDI